MYVTTMLGSPLFQILFFTYLGRYAGSQDDAFFIVGNAIQVAAMSGIYGMTMGIANERQFGTLQPLLATPANRLAIFAGRALPFVVNGLVVSAFGFAVSWLLLDFRPAEGSVPALAVAVLITTCSCVALGMLIGSIGLRARDVFFGANLVYFLMLLVCGVNVANEDLPAWLGAIGRCAPAHPRDRGGAGDRRRRDPRGRERAAHDGGADRDRLRVGGVRAVPALRARGSPPGVARDVLTAHRPGYSSASSATPPTTNAAPVARTPPHPLAEHDRGERGRDQDARLADGGDRCSVRARERGEHQGVGGEGQQPRTDRSGARRHGGAAPVPSPNEATTPRYASAAGAIPSSR